MNKIVRRAEKVVAAILALLAPIGLFCTITGYTMKDIPSFTWKCIAIALMVVWTIGAYCIAGLFIKAPAPTVMVDAQPLPDASTIPAEPKLYLSEWNKGDIPGMRIRATWAWSYVEPSGVSADPLCPVCSAGLIPTEDPGDRFLGSTPKTTVRCPNGHFTDLFEGTARQYGQALNREIARMRTNGEWKASVRRERERERLIDLEQE